MQTRSISNCEHKKLNNACKKCGACLFADDLVLKTNEYESYLNCSPARYLKHMRKRKNVPIKSKQINQSTALLLDAICEKFQYGIETRTLGMYVFAKSCQKQQKNQKFWAAAALMIASKGIELDKRVPYLNRYQRYADKAFPQEDYELAEKVIFEAMNFDVQYSTFISFLHFYMTCGIAFKSDNLSEVQVKAIEDQVLLKANIYIRHGGFLKHEPQELAISIIKQARQKFQLEPWNKYLQQLSGYNSKEIPAIKNQKSSNALQPLNYIQMKNLQKPITNSSHNSISKKNNMLSSIQNLTLNNNDSRLSKHAKKHYESTLKFHSHIKQNCGKQNTVKHHPQPLSSTLRHPNYSLSKISLSSSSDRIMPFNMFTNRR